MPRTIVPLLYLLAVEISPSKWLAFTVKVDFILTKVFDGKSKCGLIPVTQQGCSPSGKRRSQARQSSANFIDRVRQQKTLAQYGIDDLMVG